MIQHAFECLTDTVYSCVHHGSIVSPADGRCESHKAANKPGQLQAKSAEACRAKGRTAW